MSNLLSVLYLCNSLSNDDRKIFKNSVYRHINDADYIL